MHRTTLRRWRRRLAPPAAAVLLVVAMPAVGAQQQQPPTSVTLVPTADTAPSGSCNELTARVTSGGGTPVSGATVDVRQVLLDATTEPQETQELAFCNPSNPNGPNPTGQGGTAFGDVGGNNQASTAGQAGRNTDVHAEVGPTDANGEVTFGVTINSATFGDDAVVTAWWELEDDDELDEGEPSDSSTITWVGNEDRPIVSVDATPESAYLPNGGQHEITVRLMTGMGPVMGAVPSSVIVVDASGRPDGDVVDPNAGSSPNFRPGDAGPDAYSCTPTDNQGVSRCTFQDPVTTGTGTDTVVFYVDEFGEEGFDGPDPQDAVQVTWFAVPPSPTPMPTSPPTPTPTPAPTPAAPEARNVRLCHGTAGPAVCETAAVTRQTGDEHLVAALVTDRSGSPVEGVPVQLRIQGVGAFEPGGATSTLVTTGPDGVARASLGSEIAGVSSIVAEISPPGTSGSFRGPGPSDDECEQPSGGSGAPPAGNCVSQTLTVSWHDEIVTICSDGLDNDGDAFVDLDDPGCTSEEDDSELPVHDHRPLERHDRRVNMRFRDPSDPGDQRLVIFGRVRLAGDDEFRGCTEAQPVRIQRRVDGDWKTVEDATTNARGRYSVAALDRPGRYRAVALRTGLEGSDGVLHVCRRAERAKTHHHRS